MIFEKKETGKKALKIIIVGCGKVGATLTEQLSKEGNDITIIDKDQKKVHDIASYYDVMGLAGNGASYSILLDAGIKDADLLVAVTGSDELNLLTCTVAQRVGNCAAIARVRTPDYSSEIHYLRDKLGLAMIINPDMDAASEISRILYLPTALEVNPFAHGEAELIKFKVPEGNMLDGMTLAEYGKKRTDSIIICAIERGGEVIIPTGDFLMKAGDTVTFAATHKTGRNFLSHIGFNTKRVKNCMIIGGGKTSYYLAKRLLSMNIGVKIIEKDLARCEELSVLLPNAIIINGDGTDSELLKEEGLDIAESFVPLTGIDEENILLTMLAKQTSGAKIVTKINRPTYRVIENELDLGSVVYPRQITSEAIIAYARAKKASLGSNVETLYHLFDNRAEAIEFNVTESSAITGVPIRNLQLKKDLLITFINRGGKIMFPGGNDQILPGDTVMIVTTNTGFNDILDILA